MNRANQPAVLRRQVERLQALLDAEREAHKRAFDVTRRLIIENVDLKLTLQRVRDALQGDDCES